MVALNRRSRLGVMIAAACVLVLAVAAVLWWVLLRGAGDTTVTAYFDKTIGVYAGSDVRVLGVSVGTIDSVEPDGTKVKVTMTVDAGTPVPAGARAVVVAPSVVADRYVQLTPPYSSGPRMADNAVIPRSRTATPMELDQLYDSVSRLSTALGPNGANAHGALSDAVRTGAANLAGNGKQLGTLIKDFGKATRTLSGSQHDLFGTLDNLQKFTTMLKNNDGQVRHAEQQLADVSGFLADDRESLGGALSELANALGKVRGFISDNRDRIKSNVDKLASITQVLVNQRASLAETLDTAPLTLDNLLQTYDPNTHSLSGRGDLNELSFNQSFGPAAKAAPLAAPAGCGTASHGLPANCRPASLPGGLVPVSPSAAASLPALPLPADGPVYGSPRGGDHR